MNFVQFAQACGVLIDNLYPGDRIKRCGTVENPRSKNGAYFWDGQRGWVFAWDGAATVQWFNDPSVKPWTDEEKAAWKAKRQASQAAHEHEHRRAAARASDMLNEAKLGEHNYLHIKGFPTAHGFVASDSALLIPMRSVINNDLQGVQVIRFVDAETGYEKKMVPGMKAKGAVFRMGDKAAPEVILCEGYATGLSILAALRSVGLRASVLTGRHTPSEQSGAPSQALLCPNRCRRTPLFRRQTRLRWVRRTLERHGRACRWTSTRGH